MIRLLEFDPSYDVVGVILRLFDPDCTIINNQIILNKNIS